MDFSICVLIIVFLTYLYWTRHFNYFKSRQIAYIKPTPFFGNIKGVMTFKKNLGVVLKDIYDQLEGPLVGFFLMDKPAMILKDLEVIKLIWVTEFNNFSDRTLAQRKGDLGSDLLPLMRNPDWRAHRKLLTPGYSTGRIKNMYNIVIDSGVELVRYIKRVTETGTNLIDMRHVAALYGAEVVTSTAFGLKGECFRDENSGFKKAGERIFDFNDPKRSLEVTSYLMFHPLVHIFRMKFVEAKSEKFLKDEFLKIVDYRRKNNISEPDFVDILMNLRKNNKSDEVIMDDEKMVAMAITFFIAGFETTSATMSFALYELAKHPELQQRVREEATSVFDKYQAIPFEIITSGMEYTEQVMKETLRKYPPAPHLSRRCNRDYMLPGTNILIEKGMAVYLPVYAIHMDPSNYSNPTEFNPDRFSKENLKQIKPCSWLPFSVGPRNCLGERFAIINFKSAIANILYNYEVELGEDGLYEMDFHPRSFTTAPKGMKLPLKFKRIHREHTKYPE
ncbi:unnamed protein product [Phaedon cochleariae]|uniref:Cytochrome P450 n=1 Tax=Phaedon cochleariae TaxID=80249 RepID=A0A9N9SHE0_PHACE|nr:unnamed protein product [Phaedon cochleariae]